MKTDGPPEIEFAGVMVRLAELQQCQTYEGLLEGLPTKELNARRIEALLEEHPGLHLLPVVEKVIEWSRPYPFGTPASLPAVQCVARLQREDGAYFQTGKFAWFQNAWALPIDDAAMAAFRGLVWSEHSTRHEI